MSQSWWNRRTISIGVFVGLMAVLGSLWVVVNKQYQDSVRSNFENDVEQIVVDRFYLGVESAVKSLYSIRSLYSSSVEVEESEWHQFIEELLNLKEESEIYHLAFLTRESVGGKPTYTTKYIHSDEWKERLSGDSLSDVEGVSAMIDGSVISNSIKSIYVPDGLNGGRDYLLFSLPVYKNGLPIETESERVGNLEGVIVLRIDREVFFGLVTSKYPGIAVEVKIVEGEKKTVVMSNVKVVGTKSFVGLPPLRTEKRVVVGGSEWVFELAASANYRQNLVQISAPYVMLAMSLVISGLVALGIYLTFEAADSALIQAKEISERLAAREKQMVTSAPDPIVTFDKRGVVLSVNAAAARMVGLAPEKIEGKHFTDNKFMSEEMMGRCVEAFKKAQIGVYDPYELEVMGRNGEIRYLEVQTTPIKEMTEVIAYQLLMHDLTERVVASKTLMASEKLLRESQEVANLGSYELDVPGGKWKSSAVLNKIFGIDDSYQKNIGNWVKLVHPDQQEMMADYFQNEVIKAKQNFDKTYMIVRPNDKATRWVHGLGRLEIDDKGEVSKMIGTIQDVTEKHLADEELQRAKAEEDALLEAMGEAVVGLDEEMRIKYLNRKGRQFFGDKLGLIQDQALGKDCLEVLTLVDVQEKELNRDKCPWRQAYESQKIVLTTDYFFKNKRGNLIPLMIIASPIYEQGKVRGVVVIFRDITQEKEIDRAKSEFVSLASHQLRTPLSIIKWYTEIMLDEKESGKLTPQQKKFLEQIYTSGRRMVELVNALLNVSRIEMGAVGIEPVESDLVELSDQILAEQAPKLESKKLKVVKKFAKGLGPVMVDPKLYQLVLQNIISNATKYTRSGGQIEIRIETKDGQVLVMVSDNGVGIPAKLQSLVFTKLFRAENAKAQEPDGTGLGLYLAKSVIDAYGGRVWFESEENKGTTFYFTIPKGGMQPIAGTKSLI